VTAETGDYTITIHRDSDPQWFPPDETIGVVLCGYHRDFWRMPSHCKTARELGQWSADLTSAGWHLVLIEAYIHSGVRLYRSGGCAIDRQWDVSQVGFVGVGPWAKEQYEQAVKLRDEAESGAVYPPSAEHLLDIAAKYDSLDVYLDSIVDGAIETANDYLSGNVYGYVVKDQNDHEVESCWGFVGDYDSEGGVLDEAREIAQACIEKDKAEAAKFAAFCASLDWESLCELVHVCKSEEAAGINNAGVEYQVKYLREYGISDDVLTRKGERS